MDHWVCVADWSEAAPLLGLALEDQTSKGLRLAIAELPEFRSLIEITSSAETIDHRGLVRGTRFYINLDELQRGPWDLVLTVVVDIMTLGHGFPTSVAICRRLISAMKHLSEDEAEMIQVIASKIGHRGRVGWVPLDDIHAAYSEASVDPILILNSLTRKGLILRNFDGQIGLAG